MLVEFTVGNYRSFKDPVTFSMVASRLVSEDKRLDENTICEMPDGLRLLTSATIYGANASGKSNLIFALDTMQRLLYLSPRQLQATGGIPVQPFRLSTETVNQPSLFEIVFIAAGTQYRYGFEADRERVHREWLYHVPKSREALLFQREGDQVKLGRAFKEGRGLAEKTRPNALFLAVLSQFHGGTTHAITNWFLDTEIISGLDDQWPRNLTLSRWHDPEGFAQITAFMKSLDLSIEDMRLDIDPQKVARLKAEFPEMTGKEDGSLGPGTYRVRTIHPVYDTVGQQSDPVVFDLDRDESEGTQKLFALSGHLLDALASGTVLIADELDSRLHPHITRRLVEMFNSRETNPRGAQLIFTTQDTNLLDRQLLRRDQIWFTEKDRQGATHLYSLAEFQGVRNDAIYEKDYIKGRYGAIPFLGDISQLVGEGNAQKAG